MTRQPPDNPLIAVVGATGTGKSQLAVTLAKRYNGEIINGDAMQLYSGLPIITNKVTREEQQGVPHHLLGCIGLEEPTWVVGTFVKRALEIIEDIRARGKLPVLVGGTHYYTQSLLFRDQLADGEAPTLDQHEFVEDTSAKWPILRESNEVLLEELKRVDPVMADRWHPNDRRKIQRSLVIYLQTGRKASDIYAEQKSRNGLGDSMGDYETLAGRASLRFPTLTFWVHASGDALQERLNNRVDKMLTSGLLDEVSFMDTLSASQIAQGATVDETRGIWASIGYKEFKQYSEAVREGNSPEAAVGKLKDEAVERMKISTRQYAKRQVRWIRLKLADALHAARAEQNFFMLDASSAAQFGADVEDRACDLTHSFLHGTPLPPPSSISELANEMLLPKEATTPSFARRPPIKQHCDACGVTCVGHDQWQAHVVSKAHRKSTRRRKAQEFGMARKGDEG